MLHNPHLDGNSFFWSGNRIGVLLNHGLTATTAEVRLLAKILREYGYTIAAPLLPGHLTTPDDLNSVSWQEWVSAVDDYFQKLSSQCDYIFIGGESTGALLAIYLASDHPEVTGILTYAPALRLARSRFELACLRLIAPIVPYIKKANKDDDLPWQGYTVYPLRAARELTKLQHIVLDRLPDIHQPILIVHGEHDLTVHAQSPHLIYQNVSSEIKEFHLMENSTHIVLVDKEYIEVGAITQKFIARVLESIPTI